MPLTATGKALIKAARRALGLRREDVRAVRVEDRAVVIVTAGGRKIRWPGDGLQELTDSDRDGRIRPAQHRGKIYPRGYLRRKIRQREDDES